MGNNAEAIDSLRISRQCIDDAIALLKPAIVPGDLDVAPWLTLARGEIGTREIAGDEDNPRIIEYLRTTTLGRWAASRDETAWCSAFINWDMESVGIEGTGSAMARSWLGWGIELSVPREGCVVIFSRGAAPAGHVGLYIERANGQVMSLGGNQRNKVGINGYDPDRVLGYRWPAAA